MNHSDYPYTNSRYSVYAKNGMVATSHPIASEAGLEMLKRGGNAIDAAIATAATLTVVEPTSNGIGGDAFMIAWMNGKLIGVNGSGKSPQKLSMKALADKRYSQMPKFGWLPVTVPGVPKTWATLINDYGRLTLKEVLEPAINAARNGFVITPVVAKYWQIAKDVYERESEEFEEIKHWLDVFGSASVGEVKKLPYHANTLEEIAKTDAESVYTGELSKELLNFSHETGGLLTKEDLRSFNVEYVDPISINYKGYDVHEIPPNTQGIAALMALGTLSEDYFEHLDDRFYHLQIESMKQAFKDTHKHITDSRHMKVSTEELLNKNYLLSRRQEIKDNAEARETGDLNQSGTVYLATADKYGNMVSYIQSNYMGFGSLVVVPKTGLTLSNRGHNFTTDAGHVNRLEGGKRAYNTIIPGFITKDKQPIGPFGVMGGFMQPQGHLQVAMNLIDFDMNPQSALDAPRWQYKEGLKVEVERHFPTLVIEKLKSRGHDVEVNNDAGSFGRGQIILRSDAGVLVGGTEARADGSISVY